VLCILISIDTKCQLINAPGSNVNFLKLGQSAYNLLTSESSDYELSGNMKFNVPKMGQKEFPFSKVGKVPLK